MPQLARKRAIWIYLPPGYESANKRYPVIYMHDAQNLFDELTSSFGQEWAVDETLDSMIADGTKAAIVVGINNDPAKRLNEYNPYDHEKYGKGEGKEYVEFIVKTLKPYIDARFRTVANRKNTFIAGSSMGGLISMWAILKYPNVFGGAGVFSPSFWIAKGIEKDVDKYAWKVPSDSKVWFYAGGKEGESMVPDLKKIKNLFNDHSKARTLKLIDEQGQHNERAWRIYFPEFYRWVIK